MIFLKYSMFVNMDRSFEELKLIKSLSKIKINSKFFGVLLITGSVLITVDKKGFFEFIFFDFWYNFDLFMNFVILVFVVIYIIVEEITIIFINPGVINKIYKMKWHEHKVVCKRYYTESVFNDYDNYWLRNFHGGHLNQIINVGQAMLKEKEKLLMKDAIIEVSYKGSNLNSDNVVKKNLNYSLTESINKETSKIVNNLEFFYSKGLVKEENKNKFLSNINKGFECKKVSNEKVIDFAAINNLTRSASKGAKTIIEAGKIEDGPLSKGLFMFEKKTLLFFFETSEDYRKFVGFLMLYYNFDKYNARQILNTNSEEILRITSEKHVDSVMSALEYDVKKYYYYGLNSGVKMLDFLIEKMNTKDI